MDLKEGEVGHDAEVVSPVDDDQETLQLSF